MSVLGRTRPRPSARRANLAPSPQLLLDEAAAKCGVVGAQLTIYHQGALREYAAGWRNLELQLPTTTGTIFQIGSTTKVFNAALIMSLVDAGRLHLDTPVREYIRDFHLASVGAQNTVTLRHLLSVSAGIDNGPYHDYGRGDDALGCYVAALAGLPQLFEPGTAYGYSNASTNIAGHAASVVAGRTWEDLLTSQILTPLSLRASGLFAEDLLQHPVPLGYAKSDGKIPAKRLPGWALPRSMGPAGGTLCCSAGDLARFGRMLVNKGRTEDGTRVLSQESVNIMHAPQVELPTQLMAHQWCCGPYRKIWGGAAVYGHSGTNLGGSSMLLWCPERQFAVAAVVNVAPQGYPLAENIFDVIFPRLFGLDKPKTLDPEAIGPVAVNDPHRYVGKFEAFGTVMEFSVAEGKLYATEESDLNRAYGTEPVTRSELIPLGGDRFLPRNPALSGNRLWDVAFWGSDETGRATYYLNGIMPFRRVA